MPSPVCCLWFAVVVSVLSWAGSAAQAEEHRILTDGRINARPARIALDTGTSFSLAVPKRMVPAFDLAIDTDRKVDSSAAQVVAGFSKPARIELPPAYAAENAVFAILADGPASIDWDFDAVIGWPAMAGNQLHYSRRGQVVMFGRHLQPAMAGWASFPILNSNVLVFDAGNGGEPIPVLIDTGWQEASSFRMNCGRPGARKMAEADTRWPPLSPRLPDFPSGKKSSRNEFRSERRSSPTFW